MASLEMLLYCSRSALSFRGEHPDLLEQGNNGLGKFYYEAASRPKSRWIT